METNTKRDAGQEGTKELGTCELTMLSSAERVGDVPHVKEPDCVNWVPVSAPVPERTNNDYAIEFGGYLATAASRTVSSGMVRYESMLAEARKDELGTCDLAATPHAKDSKLVQCGPCKNWKPVAPQASPEAPANAMDDFRSWYTQEGSAKFDEISQKHYEPDDCTDTQLIMQEVAELTWARARLGLSGRA